MRMLASSSEITYFIEIYQTRHIGKSAIRLGISQPALTLSLQSLEEKSGAKLFHRTKQGVIPTDQGTFFYQNAHLLLDYWKHVHQKIRNSKTDLSGRFKVGCHQSVGAYTLPKLFENLNNHAPGIEIDLAHDFSRKITEAVISFNLDLGFVVNPQFHPDLVLKKLGEDRVLFWIKEGAKSVPKRIFADKNLMQIQSIIKRCTNDDLKGWQIISSSSLELIRTLVLKEQGIGILPERVATAEDANLVLYDPSLPSFKDEIYLAYRKDALMSRAGKELVRLASFRL